MEYLHNFNPEGKTENKERAYLDIVGHFPNIGKRKQIAIVLDEYWVDDADQSKAYGPKRKAGRIVLVDDTKEYIKELRSKDYEHHPQERRWDCFIYIDDYSQYDKHTYIMATIKKTWFQKLNRNFKGQGSDTGSYATGWKYEFKIDTMQYGMDSDNQIMDEIPYWIFPSKLHFKIGSQRQTLENIIEAGNLTLEFHKNKVLEPETEPEIKKKSRIPLLGGIFAVVGSILFTKARFK